jgi:hypothetical protein
VDLADHQVEALEAVAEASAEVLAEVDFLVEDQAEAGKTITFK